MTLGKRNENQFREDTDMTADTAADNDPKSFKGGFSKDNEDNCSWFNYKSPSVSPKKTGRHKTHRITLSSLPSESRETIHVKPQNPIDIIVREQTPLSINMFSAPTCVGSASLAHVCSLLKYLEPLDTEKALRQLKSRIGPKILESEPEKTTQILLNDRSTFD